MLLSLGLSALFIFLFLYIAWAQYSYPYEIDWYEGVMLDHAMRILDHKPIYAQPTVEFAAALYQPLSYYAIALFVKVGGISYSSGRLLSILASLGSAGLIGSTAYNFSKEKSSVSIAAGLFLATLDITGYTLTLCRVDALMLFFLLAGCVLLLRGNTINIILSAIAFACAYFTKQQAVFYLGAAALWLLLADRKNGLWFILTLGTIIGSITFLLQSTTNGWYGYITYYIPSVKSKTFGWLRMLTAIPYYWLRFWAGSFFIVGMYLWTKKDNFVQYLAGKEGLIMILFGTSAAQAAIHRGDQMSYTNVLLPLAAFIALATVIAVYRSHQVRHDTLFFQVGLLVQLMALLYYPTYEPLSIPGAEDRKLSAQFIQKLKSIDGEVLLPVHSFIGRLASKPTHANFQTTWDFLIVNDWIAKKLRYDLDQAYATHRYAAIITDKNTLITPDSIPGYMYAGTISTHPLFGSRVGSSLTYPYYLYLPKN